MVMYRLPKKVSLVAFFASALLVSAFYVYTTSQQIGYHDDHRQMASRNYDSVGRESDAGFHERVVVTKKSAGGRFNFTLPWMNGVSVNRIHDNPWFRSLLTFASNSDPHEPVLVVCADLNFQEALLNWLIAALVRLPHPPKNILVVTNQQRLCTFMEYHEIPVGCLSVPVSALLTAEGVKSVQAQVRQLLVVRFSVMRILNHFGYDVFNLDTDAILLKSLSPVLERLQDSHVVGTFGGKNPITLFRKWGVVACMGAMLVRSSQATELLWESMNRLIFVMDDQIALNVALKAANISWTRHQPPSPPSPVSQKVLKLAPDLTLSWEGHAPKMGLKVTLLPQQVACQELFCRRELRGRAYIWHRGKTKQQTGSTVMQDGVWFLRMDWRTAVNEERVVGLDWLKRIDNHQKIMMN